MAIFRSLIFALICKPVAYFVLGLNVYHKERLGTDGPAIIVANHNSHLDTLILFSLFPIRMLPKIKPLAAVDYFVQGRMMRWFSTRIVGILPIDRKLGDRKTDPFEKCYEALEQGDILLIFPEGTRGKPEQMSSMKSGVTRLARKFPKIPIIPIFLQGTGRSLPKGRSLFVPFMCHAIIGEAFYWNDDRAVFMDTLKAGFEDLAKEAPPLYWD